MSNLKTQQWICIALCGALLTVLGCRSAPETVEKRERPQQTQTEEMPSPEELGDHPCGNPNWAKLPPGVGEVSASEPVEPVEEDPPEETPTEESPDEID